jgi:hypothetical protein
MLAHFGMLQIHVRLGRLVCPRPKIKAVMAMAAAAVQWAEPSCGQRGKSNDHVHLHVDRAQGVLDLIQPDSYAYPSDSIVRRPVIPGSTTGDFRAVLEICEGEVWLAKNLAKSLGVGAAQSVALPSSALSKACQYALTLWKKLTRFLKHPELELSTNLAENSMRPVALGRKNWIHIGSPQAGP